MGGAKWGGQNGGGQNGGKAPPLGPVYMIPLSWNKIKMRGVIILMYSETSQQAYESSDHQ